MIIRLLAGAAFALAVCVAVTAFAQDAAKPPAPKSRCFEMRTYIANPGKIEALHARFRDHTGALFAKHGMEVVGFWTPTEGADADRTIVYILAYPSREAREASWKAFQADPDWVKAKAESEKDGVLVQKVIVTFMSPTDYSPLK